MHYQIEYYNKLWKDWLVFDQLFYKTEDQAQKRIDEYKKSIPTINTRIIQTSVLDKKPKGRPRTNTKVLVEKI